jgi:hypothetical protein
MPAFATVDEAAHAESGGAVGYQQHVRQAVVAVCEEHDPPAAPGVATSSAYKLPGRPTATRVIEIVLTHRTGPEVRVRLREADATRMVEGDRH